METIPKEVEQTIRHMVEEFLDTSETVDGDFYYNSFVDLWDDVDDILKNRKLSYWVTSKLIREYC